MLHTFQSSGPQVKMKGSMGYILEYIEGMIANQQSSFSYIEIALATGYSVPAVQRAVKELEHAKYIQVVWGGKGKPNQYMLLNNNARRTRLVAQFVGLIQ